MADPAAASATTGHDSGLLHDRAGDDADTCRICRGEGFPEDPLFYPCKCSGSIKFVHQDCLMEWLSHSQKKYCELCKTSYRFTKLYHPGMPSRIPTAVFIRRAAVHVLNMLVTWCRALLVGSTWLVFLPYCMRLVWRSLFWVGDGGWSRELYHAPFVNDTYAAPNRPWDVNQVQAAIASAKASNTSVDMPISGLPAPFSQFLNLTAGESIIWALTKRFFFGVSHPLLDFSTPVPAANSTAPAPSAQLSKTTNPTLLSDIAFLQWFPSSTANRLLLDVLEGQIITLSVVVAFILIFLIREWVVQQQPVINMVALDNEAAAEEPAVAAEPDEDADDLDSETEPEPEEPRDRVDANLYAIIAAIEQSPASSVGQSPEDLRKRLAMEILLQGSDVPRQLRDVIQTGSAQDVLHALDEVPEVKERLAMLLERLSRTDRTTDTNGVNVTPGPSTTAAKTTTEQPVPATMQSAEQTPIPPQSEQDEDEDEERSYPAPRPNMPTRNRSSIATEIRRSLEEGETWSFADAPLIPERSSDHQHEDIPDSWEEDTAKADASKDNHVEPDSPPDSEDSSDSWQQVPRSDIAASNTPSERNLEEEILGDATSSSAHDKSPSLVKPQAEARDAEIVPDAAARSSQTASPITDEPQHLDDNVEARIEEVDSVVEPVVQAPQDNIVPRQLLDIILDWLFGDIAPGVHAAEDDVNDVHIVQNLAEEPPFVPFVDDEPPEPPEPVEPGNPAAQDPEVAAAAAQAGIDVNDQDAIDDAEDLEGIMELIGMQGPLTGLFQNAMFSAVLISATLACAVWFPYLCGKIVLLLMGSPVALFLKLPLQLCAALADIVVDLALLVAGLAVSWSAWALLLAINIITFGKLAEYITGPSRAITTPASSIAAKAMSRMTHLIVEASPLPNPDYFRLSINSHAALRSIQNTTSHVLTGTGNAIVALYEDVTTQPSSRASVRLFKLISSMTVAAFSEISGRCKDFVLWIWTSKSYKITLDLDSAPSPSLAYSAAEPWTPTDRMIAIVAGYTFFAIAGAIYLRRGRPISQSRQGRKIEMIVSDILLQAGGVLKVILIISIEMLAFPLYCGLLLDIALLPLFKNASLTSRWHFARGSPWTSGFVHWFIGTCYMFHFALFVSMCRKIMRKGVLYFIRDPDDPTFHPVRDVLERSVTTQLRKIAFSALVYGALVIVCLGGVVWSLSRATSEVLPIHWTTQAPSLEFPLDLLFYNFLTPLIIKLFRPSDGLHAIYQWWFKKCARFLRLSNFLFGDKAADEQGRSITSTWTGWFSRQMGESEEPRRDAQFLKDGKFVRAPASDQARIPKGQRVFVEVDESNQRKDGHSEEGGIHNDLDMVTMVYIPPWFRVRIFCFVLTIWIFAAFTGIGMTIIPLLFGRHLFSLCLPSDVEMNDIHAFSLGIYTLGTLSYSFYQLYKFIRSLNQPMPSPISTMVQVSATIARFTIRVARFVYVWFSLAFVIPFLFAMLLELYFLMPLHAYLGPDEPHVVHIIQDWTLGFLYARLAARMVFFDRTTRAARAFSAVIANGYLNPNARLATRCFLLPVVVVFAIAVAVPSSLAWILTKTVLIGSQAATKGLVWRFSYPALGMCMLSIWAAKEGFSMLKRWRMVVRDEVYLIGERLHNFGEKRAPQPVTSGSRVAVQ